MFRSLVSMLLKALPGGAPAWIYTVVLKPAPLRWLANKLLLRLVPPAIDLPEGTLILNQEDPVVSGALALGVYENGSLLAWRRVLDRPDMQVLDVGGNIGLYSLIAAGRCSRGRVLAFEPEPRNAEILTAMAQQNGFDNLQLIRAGAGSSSTSANLYLDPDNKGKHSLVKEGSGQSTTSIELVSVDEAAAEHGFDRIDAVKIDVEGWEEQVFVGMAGILERDHPAILFELAPVRIEASGGNPKEMLLGLQSRGYHLSIVDESNGELEKVDDIPALLARFAHRDAYCNLFATWVPG